MPEKTLFRSTSNRMISGICGGLAEYFDVDTSVLRIAMVAFTVITLPVFGPFVFLAYLVCIFIIPRNPVTASTAAAGAPPGSGQADQAVRKVQADLATQGDEAVRKVLADEKVLADQVDQEKKVDQADQTDQAKSGRPGGPSRKDRPGETDRTDESGETDRPGTPEYHPEQQHGLGYSADPAGRDGADLFIYTGIRTILLHSANGTHRGHWRGGIHPDRFQGTNHGGLQTSTTVPVTRRQKDLRRVQRPRGCVRSGSHPRTHRVLHRFSLFRGNGYADLPFHGICHARGTSRASGPGRVDRAVFHRAADLSLRPRPRDRDTVPAARSGLTTGTITTKITHDQSAP